MSPPAPAATPPHPRAARWFAPALVALVALAFGNSFSGVFVFDDDSSIVTNPTLQSFATSFIPPAGGHTVSGRPLLNASLALNHAVSGTAPWSYHALNLLIHAAAALTLLGLTRRLLRLPRLAGRFGADADWLAFALASLWAVHPIQTESVTYIVQRAESLAGLFYLLTLYTYLRSTTSAARAGWWQAGSVAACALGVLTKETVATAPLAVVLVDALLVHDTWTAALARHRRLYAGLAATWLISAALIAGNYNRGGSAGFATEVSSLAYAQVQLRALLVYLRTIFWPHPVVFDYGQDVAVSSAHLAAGGALLAALLGGTGLALRRRQALGVAGAVFCLLLAPSSSFVPVATQPIALHRLYLPLALVLGVILLGATQWLGRRRLLAGTALAVSGCLLLTVRQNRLYAQPLALWQHAATHVPDNARAHQNYGVFLDYQGDHTGAIAAYERALALHPTMPDAHFSLANVLHELGREEEAAEHYAEAVARRDAYPGAHYNLGNYYARRGNYPKARLHFEAALRLRPDYANARVNLGNTYAELGRMADAAACFRAALAAEPGRADLHLNLGIVLAQLQDWAGAAAAFEATLRLEPDNATAAQNLAFARNQLRASPPR